MLVCNNLGYNFGSRHIFAGVSFTLGKGALLVLHGPNGAGKTSLLHILAGIKSANNGQVAWNEQPIAESIRNGEVLINYVGHEKVIKPDLTVLENIEFLARLFGDLSKVEEAIEVFGLRKYLKTKCSELSRGWQKRVLLSKLIFAPSDIWVLDEPYNNLDSSVCTVLDGLIANKCKEGGIVIASSHTVIPIDFAVKLNIAEFAAR